MILITGSTGFLGTAVCRRLHDLRIPHTALGGRSEGVDLREPGTLEERLTPETQGVIHLAYPGTDGIGTSLETPADLAMAVLEIDMTVINDCANSRVRLITVGSVCSYPEIVTFPTDEGQLFNGPPEAVNAPYGHAKRMQLALLDAHHRQFQLDYTALILSNLYGPGDRSGHVIPATIRKVIQATREEAGEIVVWGDGTATREFLFVEDAAEAIVMAALHPRAFNRYLNICTGEEVPIKTLVEETCQQVGFLGDIRWDASKPNGQPRRCFSNVGAAVNLAWHPRTRFRAGLTKTIQSMQEEQ